MTSLSLRRTRRHAAGFLSLFVASFTVTHGQVAQRPTGASQTQVEAAVADRISATPDWSRLQPLSNHVPLWAHAQDSTGPATSEMALTLVISHPPGQQAALQQFLSDQKNPASPEFHHWLTPAEFGQRFGLSEPDVEAVETWLRTQGLHINFVSPSRTFIGFGGSASAVGRAFGTEVRTYLVNGKDRMSIASDPMIPAALAPVVKAIHGFYTVDEHPVHFMTEPQLGVANFSLASGNEFIVPGDFQTIYDGVVSASGYQQTIGIVGQSRTDFDDFKNFMGRTASNFQLPTEIVPTAFGGVDPGPAYTSAPPLGVSLEDQSEATLDVTRAGSVAPNANILLVIATSASGGIEADAQYLVQTSPLPAQVITISYGDCETSAGQAGVSLWDSLFEQAAAEGISVFVASGDSGAAGCEQAFTTPLANPPAISPNYICSSSYATCVGGTEFNDASNPSQYWSTSNGTNLASAQMYIPEGGWNEPTGSGGAQVAGSGGGVSSLIATPKWQTGTGVPSARAGRYTPDVSFSSSCHDSYFACLAAGGGNCVPDSKGNFYFVGLCGTSAAAPSMAGVAALLDEKMTYPQGNINPEIYAMAQSQPSPFHDTTPSSSGVTNCDIHTPSMCNNSTPGTTGLAGGQDGYPVTVGYDMVTGVGSVDIAKFITNFATSLPRPSLTVTPSSQNITSGQSLTIAVNADGGTGQPAPTGTISLTSWGYNSPGETVANGTATFTIPAYTLPWSVDTTTFSAQYTPDAPSSSVYSPAVSMTSVAVNPVSSSVTLNLTPSTVTTAQDVSLTVTVAGPSGAPSPTGTISINTVGNGPAYAASGTLSGGSLTLTIPAGVLPPGTDTIDANYAPDKQGGRVYNTNIANANITVTQGPKTTPTLEIMLSASSITLADSLTASVKVVPLAGAPTATGTVSFTGNGRTLTASLSGGAAQIVAGPAWLPIGADSLTIGYSGDYNNNSASASASVIVTKAVPTMLVSPAASTISSGQSLDVNVSVNTAMNVAMPTGTVTLTSGSYTSAATSLLAGSTTITIPAGSLAAGTDPLAGSYSGDANYTGASATGIVMVTAVPASFTVGATNLTVSSPGTATGNISTVTVTPQGGFTGSVSLSAKVTSSPAGAQHPPTVSFGTTTPVNINGTSGVTAMLTVTTTAPTSAMFERSTPAHSCYAEGGTALAFLLLLGVPARRPRNWRAWFSMLVLIAGLSNGIVACGGGGSSSSPPPVTTPGTTAGTYVVTITATSDSLTASTTLNVIVQ